jgi:hypothetical protein
VVKDLEADRVVKGAVSESAPSARRLFRVKE